MTAPARKIAVVGIDGCGKSTVIRRFLELSPLEKGEALVMNCPLYHDTPNSPLRDLSRRMDAFSQAADRLGSFELKAAALYLQMTLYGCVESFFLETYRPRFLLSERHALVDSLAYGPFYGKMVQKEITAEEWEAPLRRELEKFSEGTLEAIQSWHRQENRRGGRTGNFWDIPSDVRDIFGQQVERTIELLGERYRTSLPDVVLLLDLPAEVARERVGRREGATRELHETTSMLDALRKSYHHVVPGLGSRVETHVIDTGSGASIDETLEVVLQRAGLERQTK